MSDNKPTDAKGSIASLTNVIIDLPSPEDSAELLNVVMNHYIKHHKVVLKKLEHAQNATNKSLEELEEYQENENGPDNEELEQVKLYDEMWDYVIDKFRLSGIAEEELARIEATLLTIPHAIKKYYDVFVSQDRALCELIEELSDNKYTQALNTVKNVQAASNPMSLLGPEEYAFQEDVDLTDVRKAFMITPLLPEK